MRERPPSLLARRPWPPAEIRSAASLYACLDAHVALVLPGFFSPEEAGQAARAVLAARADWTENFEGVQFSLGRAWYTHLEQDRSHEYFANAAASNAAVERHLPGLSARLMAAIGRLVSGEVRLRPGWCGAGVHIFPANGWLSENGGDVHFDTEGLPEHHVDAGARALSVVLMFQPPARGGGLRLWDTYFEGEDHPSEEQVARPSAAVAYGAGDLVVFDSYRLHQIEPFEGDLDRVSATIHAAEVSEGSWEAWF